jgi:hypothetical protein
VKPKVHVLALIRLFWHIFINHYYTHTYMTQSSWLVILPLTY